MAVLSGLTVSCLATGGPTVVGQLQHLPSRMIWSEAPASGVVSSNSAPGVPAEYGPLIFRVYATANSWIAISGGVPGSSNPNSAASPRVFLPANTERDYIVLPGDKIMWQADA